MTRFIVTGATGFIGRRLLELLLEQGHSVTAMLHTSESDSGLDARVDSFRADVTQPATLQGKFRQCDVVVHLAGCTIERAKHEFELVNHQGTLHVASECASESDPPRFLFVSSLAAAGPSKPGKPHVESDPAQPVSNYGKSKRDAEQALLKLSNRLPICIVRPPSVFGDTDPYLLSLFKAAKWGLVVMAGRGTHSYSYIHVDDLARVLLHLAECSSVQCHECDPDPLMSDTASRSNQPPRNSSNGNSLPDARLVFAAHHPPLTFPQVADLVADAVGTKRVRRIHIPGPFCWTLAWVNSVVGRLFRLRPLLNLDKMREGMAGSWACDSTFLTEDLRFEFPRPLESQIRETAKSYQAMGKM